MKPAWSSSSSCAEYGSRRRWPSSWGTTTPGLGKPTCSPPASTVVVPLMSNGAVPTASGGVDSAVPNVTSSMNTSSLTAAAPLATVVNAMPVSAVVALVRLELLPTVGPADPMYSPSTLTRAAALSLGTATSTCDHSPSETLPAGASSRHVAVHCSYHSMLPSSRIARRNWALAGWPVGCSDSPMRLNVNPCSDWGLTWKER